MKNSRVHYLTVSVVWLSLKCAVAVVALLAGVATAQTSSTYSSTDGKTPSGMQAGNSAGSYALSGFDSINPFSGSLSFRLPLLSIGGRGAAGYTMTLPIEKKWRVEHTINDPNLYCQHCETYEVTHTYSPDDQSWGAMPGYGAGLLQGRRAGKDPVACHSSNNSSKAYAQTLTRLTFTTSDGTEYELRDQLWGGMPLTGACGASPSRGTVFVTADGTSATFIADAPILDYSNVNDYPPFYPSGHLLMRDGTRYGINGGQVEWIQDRQGNRVTIGAAGGQTQITDALGRTTTVSYARLPSVPYDEITFAGVGGIPRHIRVYYASLSSRLRTGYSIKTYNSLFAGLGGSSHSNYDPSVVSSVVLPDGRAYHFLYNSHGELARVELPTGGVFEYDFQSSDGVIDLSTQSHDTFGLVNEYEIYRRAESKRVYGSGGTLESQTWFSLADGSANNNTVAQVTTYSAGGNLLAAEKHYYYGSAYPHPAWFTHPTHYAAWNEGKEYKTETLGADGLTVLRRSEQTWQQRAPLSWWNPNYGPEPANDPRVTHSVMTLTDSGQVTKQSFAYDEFNNQTDVWEYDYGTGAPPPYPTRHMHTDYLTVNPSNSTDYTLQTGAHIRSLPRAQAVYAVDAATGAESLAARSETRYDEVAYPLLTYGAASGWVNPNTSARGNATTMRRWLDTTNTWVETHTQYDQLGNVRKAWDALGNSSEVEYASTYHYTYPTHTISAVPDPTNARATNTPLESWTTYDFWTGKVTSTTDANQNTASYQYADALDRLTRVNRPDGGWTTYWYDRNAYGDYIGSRTAINAAQHTESYQFFDGLGRGVRSFQLDGSQWMTSDTEYDALGRVWRISNSYLTSGAGTLINPSNNWTTTAYDALGRVLTATTPEGARVLTAYHGNEVTVTDQAGKRRRSVTDALGRLTSVYEDPHASGYTGLNYQTSYSYDVLGNLRGVAQDQPPDAQYPQGVQQRRYFMYDSLGRLIRAKNPEQGNFTPDAHFPALTDATSGTSIGQWSTGYTYDANGNLSKRRDARNITTTYTYDPLNRVLDIGYSDGVTPGVGRVYDKATNGRGRLAWDWTYIGPNGANSRTAIDAYDPMGQVKAQRQHFWVDGDWGPAYPVSRTYDLMGHVIEQTYPSEHKVYYSQFDAAGRLKHFKGNLGDGTPRTYATDITYDEASRLSREQFGTETPLYHKRRYNVRGQMWDVRLSTVDDVENWNRGAIQTWYTAQNQNGGGSGTDNNGNVRRARTFIPGDDAISSSSFLEQRYDYDQLNRLKYVEEYLNGQGAPIRQEYDYDRWGNRTINQAGTTQPGPNVTLPPGMSKAFKEDPATNRLGVPVGQLGAMGYDAAGNLTDDTYTGAGARVYDAENRMTSAAVPGLNNNNASAYTYDADGRRVRRQSPAESVWQVYGIDGELLAEYAASAAPSAPQKEYGYRNGELLITAQGATSTTTAPAVNVAAAAQGATASSSSNYPYGTYNAAATINGDRRGANWGAGGGWNDGTLDSFPDWLEVDFNGTKTINEVSVFTCQDNYANPTEPTLAQTFTLYGLTAFEVQYWTGTAWVSVPGASVAGNDRVWRKFTFPALTTQKIRVVTSAGLASYSRLTEVEAWGAPQAATDKSVRWLVTDHLGTPRMVADMSGSLAGIRRHDYLPFGEEVGAGVGGRTAEQGYAEDNVRQQFTGYERDDETELDFAQARYYASQQGRFMSADPYNIVMETQTASDKEAAQKQFVSYLSNPQRWHRYHYGLNNPLLYTDPNGEDVTIYYRPDRGSTKDLDDFGHIFIYVRNDETGESAYFDYYTQDGATRLAQVTQARIREHASLTIETNTTQEQAILNGIIEAQQSVPDYDWLPNLTDTTTNQCTNMSAALLAKGGINLGNPTLPSSAWKSAFNQYGDKSKAETGGGYYSGAPLSRARVYIPPYSRSPTPQAGNEYGSDPRGQARQVDGKATNNRTLLFRDGKRLN